MLTDLKIIHNNNNDDDDYNNKIIIHVIIRPMTIVYIEKSNVHRGLNFAIWGSCLMQQNKTC